MNGLKKFFGKNDIEVFESGKKSAEQAKQKTRKSKSSRWKKYLAVGASLAILGFANPLGAEKESLASDFQGNSPLKANTIEMTSDIVSGGSSTLLAMNDVSGNSDQTVQQNYPQEGPKEYYSKVRSMDDKLVRTKEGKKLQKKMEASIIFEEGEIITRKRGEEGFTEETGIREKNPTDKYMEILYIAYLAKPYIYKDDAVENDAGNALFKFALSKDTKFRMHFPEEDEVFSAKTTYEQIKNKKGETKNTPVITISWPKDFNFPDKYKRGDNFYDLLPSDKYAYTFMRALGHELRHLWQIENGMPLVEKTDHLHDQIMKKRIREADATAIETLITWQMNKKFKNIKPDDNSLLPYDYYLMDNEKNDIALSFKQSKETSLPLSDEYAAGNAFNNWYGNENRNRPYDEQIVDNWIASKNTKPSFKPEEWAEKLILPTTGKRYALISDASVDHILKQPKFFGVSEDIKKQMDGKIPDKDIKAIPTYPVKSQKNNTMNFDKHTDKTKQQTAFNRNKKDSRDIAAIIRKQKLHRRS